MSAKPSKPTGAQLYKRIYAQSEDVRRCNREAQARTYARKRGETVPFLKSPAPIKPGDKRLKHRMMSSPEYKCWSAMRTRCLNPRSKQYYDYGGRGISIFPSWTDFLTFYRDMGPRPSPNHSLDRYPDRNGNYEPGNCRWATWHQQNRNRKDNVLITFNNKTLCISEWAGHVGISRAAMRQRLLNWSVHRSLTEVADPKKVMAGLSSAHARKAKLA